MCCKTKQPVWFLASQYERARESLFDNPNELADVWTAVGQIGSTAVGYLFGGGGSGSGPARGLAQINAVGQQAIQALQQILQIAHQNPQQAVSNARSIVAALSDPAIVYQAQRGDDAAALRNAKAEAAALLQQIEAIASVSPTSATAVNAGGNVAISNVAISTSMVLLIGGGILGLMLLKK